MPDVASYKVYNRAARSCSGVGRVYAWYHASSSLSSRVPTTSVPYADRASKETLSASCGDETSPRMGGAR